CPRQWPTGCVGAAAIFVGPRAAYLGAGPLCCAVEVACIAGCMFCTRHLTDVAPARRAGPGPPRQPHLPASDTRTPPGRRRDAGGSPRFICLKVLARLLPLVTQGQTQ